MAEAILIVAAGVVTTIGEGLAPFASGLRDPGGSPGNRGYLMERAFPFAALPKSMGERGDCDASTILNSCMRQILGNETCRGLDLSDRRVGVVLGSTCGIYPNLDPSSDWIDGAWEEIDSFREDRVVDRFASDWGLRGMRLTVANACASSANAICLAADLLSRGKLDFAIAGGASVIGRFDAKGFFASRLLCKNECRPFSSSCEGLMLGEGGGLVLMRRAPFSGDAWGRLLGYACNMEAVSVANPQESGSALTDCVQAALRRAGVSPDAISYVNAHGTGTKANDASEIRALNRLWADCGGTWIGSTKPLHGHLRAGGGVVEAIACLLSMDGSFIPASLGLESPNPECRFRIPRAGVETESKMAVSIARGFGGVNCAMILGRGRD